MAPPNPRVVQAFRAMRNIGIPEEKTKPALKKLLKLYNKNWEPIEQENYRALAETISNSDESKVVEQKKKLDDAEAAEKKRVEQAEATEDETQIQEEPEKPLKRLRVNELPEYQHQPGLQSPAEITVSGSVLRTVSPLKEDMNNGTQAPLPKILTKPNDQPLTDDPPRVEVPLSLIMPGMGLFQRMKVSVKPPVIEDTEPVTEGLPSTSDNNLQCVTPLRNHTTPPEREMSTGTGLQAATADVGYSRRHKQNSKNVPARGDLFGDVKFGDQEDEGDAAYTDSGSGFSGKDVGGLRLFGSSSGNKTVRSLVDSESRKLNLEEKFIPDWEFTNGTVLDTPSLCREFMHLVRTPLEVSHASEMTNKQLSNVGCSSAVNALFTFIETHQRWVTSVGETRALQKQVAQLQDAQQKLQAHNSTLQKCVTDVKAKSSMAEVEKERVARLEAEARFRKDLSLLKNDLDAKSLALDCLTTAYENDASSRSRISELEANVNRVTEERRWLIAEGIRQGFEKIRNSDEYLDLLAKINSMSYKAGYNVGLCEGVKLGRRGIRAEDDEGYREDAHDELRELSDEFDATVFPILTTMAGMTESSLADIQAFLAPVDG